MLRSAMSERGFQGLNLVSLPEIKVLGPGTAWRGMAANCLLRLGLPPNRLGPGLGVE